MKKYILITSFIFFAIAAKAQFTVSYSAGYGDYKMEYLKEMAEKAFAQMQEQVPGVDLKLLSNYPGYITHGIALTYMRKNHEMGFTGTYLTTGAKMAYADYSGEIMQKSAINGYRVGVVYRFFQPVADLSSLGKLSVFGEVSPGIMFSNYEESGYLIVNNTSLSNTSYKFSNTLFSIVPAVGLRLNVTPGLAFNLSGGYDFSFYGDQWETVNSMIINKEMDWSGIRINAGVSYTFGKN